MNRQHSTSGGGDVVVIGGGPCGAIAAARLVEAGLSVTMLDSGRRAPVGVVAKAQGRTVFRWVERRQLVADRHHSATDPSTSWYSSLSLGGLTNYWTGAVPRFAPDDFTDGTRCDERYEWPISYEDLVPYYDVAERLVRPTSGPPIPGIPTGWSAHTWRAPDDWADLATTASARGFPVGALPLAKGAPWMLAFRGNEFDSYHGIVRPLVRRGRLTLLRGSHAIRLRHGDGVATGVEYVDTTTNTVRTLRADAFVLAAGALDTTEILLRSTSPELPGGLGSSHGVLGRYVHDHPREWYPLRVQRAMTALVHPMYLARDDLGSSPPLMALSSTLGLASQRDRIRTFYGGKVQTIGVQAFGTMVPSPDHGVHLVDGADPASTSSRLHIDLVYDQAAIDNVERGRHRLLAALAELGMPADAGPFHALIPGSSVHFGGTARMHRDPRYGVVDEWNRVYDAPNTLVCDASCFTTGPEKNPTLTAMAIAARAAQHLATGTA